MLHHAAKGAVDGGAEVAFLDLRDYPLPIYDGDIESEQGIPENARRIREHLLTSSGFLIASPEYNGSVSPVLKNALDWASRSDSEDGLEPFRSKLAVIMSASPGNYGGLRGLEHLRAILSTIGMIVLPHQLAIGNAAEVFPALDRAGHAKQTAAIAELGNALATALVTVHGQQLLEAPFERRHDIRRIV
jgi:NAD(P)H-dependent FMN reductase